MSHGASAPQSLGVEIDESLCDISRSRISCAVDEGRRLAEGRLAAHKRFVVESEVSEHPLGHENRHYGFPVKSSQEVDLVLYRPDRVTSHGESFEVEHVAAETPLIETQVEFL